MITITSFTNLTILSTSAACPNDTSSVCEKICAFGTAGYEVTGVPPTSQVDWEVIGAESYTANGTQLSVDWGAPGQGLVTATVGNSTLSPPLQVFCWQSSLPNQPGGGQFSQGQAIAFGGQPPYAFFLSNGFGGSLPTFPNLSPGTYSVTVTDAAGATETCSFDIVMSDSDCWAAAHPVELAHASNCNSCDGFIQVEPTGGNLAQYSFLWNNGETTSAITNLCPGLYSFTITDGLGCSFSEAIEIACPTGCSGSATLCVDILEEPEAAIGSIPPAVNGIIAICQGQTVFFQNESLNATSYVWDFGDFNTSTQFEPNHTYNVPGTYPVTLIARNECFCADTTFVSVYVIAADVPEIKCVGTICEGETVTYSTDANCGTYNWSITGGGVILDGGGPGDNFITVQWQAGPEGTVSLDVSGCAGSVCNLPNVVPIPILSDNVQIQGPDKVCQNSTEEYFIPDYQGTAINWTVAGSGNIVDGQGTERITVLWYGDANVGNPQKVIVEFDNCYLGCTGKDTLLVSIVPEFYVTGPIEVCQNSIGSFQSRNAITTALTNSNWTVYNASGAAVWTSPGATNTVNIPWNFPSGSYVVRAVPTGSFCNDKYDVFVKVLALPPPPGGITGATEICPGESYTYEASGSPVNDFTWTIQNGGSTSTLSGNPINVTWGALPPWSVSAAQVATTGLGCISDTVKLVIGPLPDFSIAGDAQVCKEATGAYSVPFFENIQYQWTVTPASAGTVISGQGTESVSVLWHSAGSGTVSVTFCGVTKTFNVNVLPLPEPFVPDQEICAGETAAVSAGAFAGYLWVNESGTAVSFSANPMLGGGYYEVEVTDANGCKGDTTFYVHEHPLPVTSISTPAYFALCSGGQPATIYAMITGSGYDFQWFQDGAPVGGNVPTYSTTQPGDYHVVVTDINGCTAASNHKILVDCASVGGTCVNGICTEPGGGGPSIPGGGGGCNPAGTINFDPMTTADCNTIDFQNTSVNFVPGTMSWYFDDPASGANNTSTLHSPSHTFTSAGFFTVVLIGGVNSSPPGSTCYLGLYKDVLVPAAANFEYEPACPGTPVEFTDLSTFVPTTSLTAWEWDFGDPASGAANTSSLQYPTHTYTSTGNYTVTLTITAANGCQTSISKTVTVNPLPGAIFIPPTQTCENTALPFGFIPLSDITSVSWNFGDPASGAANGSSSENPFHEFDAPGSYIIALTTANVYGCTATFSQNVAVTPNTLGGNIALSPPSPICEGDSTVLTAPTGGISWLWSNGATLNHITVQQSSVSTVTLTDAQGCTYSPPPALVDVIAEPNGIIKAVEYNEFGQPVALFENSYSICEGEDVNLIITGNTNYSYVWSGGDTGDEISFTEIKGNLLAEGTHTFTVTVTDNLSGCTSVEGPFTVTVNPVPDVQIASLPSGFICENTSATLNVVSPQGGLTYIWNTGEMGTSITVVAGGAYFVRAINSFGCIGKSNEIEIHNAPDIDLVPPGCHTRCKPDTMCLPDISSYDYQWYLDGAPMTGPNGTQANPVFTESGEYTVEITDQFGCVATSSPLALDLYDGYGDILGNVWFDVNSNGIIDGADTLVSGIQIFLTDNGAYLDMTASAGGGYIFVDILATDYTLVLDTVNLPANWSALLVSTDLELIGCDDEEQFDWLLMKTCLPSATAIDMSACEGESVTYNGTAILAGDEMTFQFTNQEGCDSMVTVTVLELPQNQGSVQLSACPGESAVYAGTPIPAGQQMTFDLTNQFGCDSMVTVTVLELPQNQGNVQLSACAGENAVYAGTPILAGQQMTFDLTNQFGCDSTVAVTVAELPHTVLVIDAVACANSFFEYQGVQIPPNSEMIFSQVNADGCLDTLIVAVGELPVTASALTLTACGNSFVEYAGTQLFPGDVTDFTLTNSWGCDSVVTVTVTGAPLDTTFVSLQVCEGETVEYNGQQLSAGDQINLVVTNQFGCDSTVMVTVAASPAVSYELATQQICWNAGDGAITVTNLQGSTPPYLFSLDGQTFQSGAVFDSLSGGNYTVFLQDAYDCIFEEETVIPVIPPMTVMAQDETIVCGDSIRLQPVVFSSVPFTWEWQDGSSNPYFTIGAPGVYSFQVANECETVEQSVNVALEDSESASPIYMPSAFSPNNDGVNDCFRGYIAPTLQLLEYELKIFDRWGDLMFETYIVEGCWDGVFKGKRMDPAVFVWYIRMKVVNCDGREAELFKEGGVTLVK